LLQIKIYKMRLKNNKIKINNISDLSIFNTFPLGTYE